MKIERVTVYILFCGDNTYYTGITANLSKRYKQHCKGLSKSTKHKQPVVIAWSIEMSSRRVAAKLERLIKNRGASYIITKYSLKVEVKHSNGLPYIAGQPINVHSDYFEKICSV